MSTRTQVRAFVIFVTLSVVHVVVLLGHFPVPNLSLSTKALLVPALAAGAFWLLRGRRIGAPPRVALALALALSWIGDIAVGLPGAGFLIGLSAFLLALVAYAVLIGRWVAPRRPRIWALVYLPWFAAVLLVLLPHVGALAVPVILYGLALGTLAVIATGSGPLVAAGGAVFLASDTVLALKLFVPGFEEAVWQIDALIMVLYTIGQGMLVAGAVARLAARPSAARDAADPRA